MIFLRRVLWMDHVRIGIVLKKLLVCLLQFPLWPFVGIYRCWAELISLISWIRAASGVLVTRFSSSSSCTRAYRSLNPAIEAYFSLRAIPAACIRTRRFDFFQHTTLLLISSLGSRLFLWFIYLWINFAPLSVHVWHNLQFLVGKPYLLLFNSCKLILHVR